MDFWEDTTQSRISGILFYPNHPSIRSSNIPFPLGRAEDEGRRDEDQE
jgi:hypothetical protein